MKLRSLRSPESPISRRARVGRPVGAALATLALSVPALAGAIASGYPPFPTDANQPGVWSVTQPTGQNTTTIELRSVADGSIMHTLGSFGGSFNALAYPGRMTP